MWREGRVRGRGHLSQAFALVETHLLVVGDGQLHRGRGVVGLRLLLLLLMMMSSRQEKKKKKEKEPRRTCNRNKRVDSNR